MSSPGYFLVILGMSAVSLLFAFPFTIGVLLVAVIALRGGPLRGQPLGVPRLHRWAPPALLLAVAVWGGIFATTALEAPRSWPPAAYGVVALFALMVVVAADTVRRARRRRAAFAVVVTWLWFELVTSWVALWAVLAGGTLGAL